MMAAAAMGEVGGCARVTRFNLAMLPLWPSNFFALAKILAGRGVGPEHRFDRAGRRRAAGGMRKDEAPSARPMTTHNANSRSAPDQCHATLIAKGA